MAKFEEAYKLVADFEGSYSNVKSDRGGETYCGIARNFSPNGLAGQYWIGKNP